MAEALGTTYTPWDELPRWRRVRYRVEFAGLWLAARIIPLLPWRVVRGLAGVLGRIAFRFDRRSRAIALDNLVMVYGTGKSPAEIRRIARASTVQFARTMLELFWARNFTAENYRDHMVMEGWDQARALNEKHRGGIFVCLHYGNFEWLSIAGAFERLPGCIVTQQFRNPLLGPIFDELRAMSGHRIVSQERSMMVTLKHLKKGGNIGILFDLQLSPNQPAVPMRSFGRWRPATKIHAMLQRHTGLPIIPIESVPLPDGRYRTIAHDPIYFAEDATEAEIVQKCWDFFEPQVRRQPEAWLWAYRHWRFRPPAAEETYPEYAEVKGRFTRLLQDAVAESAPRAQDEV